jgi:8-hydroxy-5-deazaflavin:NADPH oxidoreductase
MESSMRIAIIGAGNIGAGLARRLVAAGHSVTVSASRTDSERLTALAAETGVGTAATLPAAEAAEVIVLAVPFTTVDDVLSPDVVAAAAGKTVIDVTNPLAPDFMSLTIGYTSSAGETVADRLPRSSVVKAFNTIIAQNLDTPVLGGTRLLLPVAGDDTAAKTVVLELGRELGFDAVDAGPLSNARYLEPAMELFIQLAFAQGMGPGIGLALARA